MIYVATGLAGLLVAAAAAWIALPSFLEQPEYTVLRKEGAFELRAYGPMTVAEVTRTGPRREALGDGFRPLARYIFARDREGESIAMTAPVTQQAAPGPDAWAVRFVMPARYDLESLPEPASGSVELIGMPAATRAAIRFRGVATDDLLAGQEARLRDWIADGGLTPRGTPVHAYYNDPSTPGIFRRNEILIEVEPPLPPEQPG